MIYYDEHYDCVGTVELIIKKEIYGEDVEESKS